MLKLHPFVHLFKKYFIHVEVYASDFRHSFEVDFLCFAVFPVTKKESEVFITFRCSSKLSYICLQILNYCINRIR